MGLSNISMKKMENMKDYSIELLEQEIVDAYNGMLKYKGVDYRDLGCLLELRKSILNKEALDCQEELLPDIITFNDALRDALKEMYDRAHSIWKEIKNKDAWGESMELTAHCYLGYDYPSLHPVQGEDRQELWDAICDFGWNRLYDTGVSFPLVLPRDLHKSFETFIGMDCPPPNWNEGLDQELTKNLHLIQQFHNLFDHMEFAITDFIYVRKFETEINIEISKSL